MGVDLWMEKKRCRTCGHLEHEASMGCTYNLAKMWFEIYPDDQTKGMIYIDELTGSKALPILKKALDELNEHPDKFKEMNPANGWGSYESFCEYITNLIELCEKHPTWIWKSWR